MVLPPRKRYPESDYGNLGSEYTILGNPSVTSLQGYIVYKSGSNYITQNLLTSTKLYTGSSFVAAVQAASDDVTPVSPVSAALIKVVRPSTPIVIDGLINFAGKSIYFDGGFAEYDFHSYDGICFQFDGSAAGLNGFPEGGIKNCYLYGNKTNTNSIFVAAKNVRMAIEALNAARDGSPGSYNTRSCYAAIKLENDCYINTIKNCNFHAVIPVYVGATCNGTWIYDCDFGYEAASNGVIIAGGTPVSVEDCYFEDLDIAVLITGGSTVSVRNCYINAASVGIACTGVTLIDFSENQIYTPTGSTGFIGIRMYGNVYYSGHICNNTIWGLGAQTNFIGIQLEGAKNLNISNNYIALANAGCIGLLQTGTSSNLHINNNRFQGAAACDAAIRIALTSQSMISNNWLMDFPIAIDLTGACTEVQICGNYTQNKTVTFGTAPTRVYFSDAINTNLTARSEFKGKLNTYYDATNYYVYTYDGTNSRRAILPKNEKYGATASVADGGTITHNLGATPTGVTAIGSVANEIIAITALGATTFTVAIKKRTDGSAGTSQTIYWQAWII